MVAGKWKVDHIEELIYVPQNELEEAQENDEVQDLQQLGYMIQTEIPS